MGLFDSIKKVKIYIGPIHTMYPDKFKLVRGQIGFKPNTSEVFKSRANFYKDAESGPEYKNLEFGCVLPSFDAALAACTKVVNDHKDTLKKIITDEITDKQKEDKLKEEIIEAATILYYEKLDVVFNREITQKEFKSLEKTAAESRKKQKQNKK